MKEGRQELDVTWGRTIKVWWAWLWRSVLWSILAGAVLGGISGVILALVGGGDVAGTAGAILGYVAGLVVSIIILKQILQKSFGDFRVSLRSTSVPEEGETSQAAVKSE